MKKKKPFNSENLAKMVNFPVFPYKIGLKKWNWCLFSVIIHLSPPRFFYCDISPYNSKPSGFIFIKLNVFITTNCPTQRHFRSHDYNQFRKIIPTIPNSSFIPFIRSNIYSTHCRFIRTII